MTAPAAALRTGMPARPPAAEAITPSDLRALVPTSRRARSERVGAVG
ncbi:hypothetical protein [Nocardia cyriacigeorgica]